MTPVACRIETFPALETETFQRSIFIARCPDTPVHTDRTTALDRLAAPHRSTALRAHFAFDQLATAEQIHGAAIARVDGPGFFSGVDGLITNVPHIPLGIYVADCAAVYLIDRRTHAIGLVHSGKKGTELGIVPNAITAMQQAYGTQPADLILQIAPCIRPPHYEIDFAAEILRSAQIAGVRELHDSGTCTASHPDAYYSYRREMGQTGRMLALLERIS